MSCRSLALLVALAALLAACQPTPAEDVVVNKGEGPAFAFATEAPGGAAAAVETPTPPPRPTRILRATSPTRNACTRGT